MQNTIKNKQKKLPVFRLPCEGAQLGKTKVVMLLPQIKCKNQAVSTYTHTHTCVYIKFKKYRQNCPFLWLFAVRQGLLQPGQTCGHLHENLCGYKMHLTQPGDPNPSQYLHFHLKKRKGKMKYQHSTSNSAQPPQNSTHAWTQIIPGCSPRWKHQPSPCWHGSSCTAGSFQPVLAADLHSLQTPLRYVD